MDTPQSVVDADSRSKSVGEIVGLVLVAIFCIAVLAGAIGIGIGTANMNKNSRPSPASRPQTCGDLWEANKATAEAPGMDREQYIANCEETNRDLQDGKLDGK
jgi:hypothetical protein